MTHLLHKKLRAKNKRVLQKCITDVVYATMDFYFMPKIVVKRHQCNVRKYIKTPRFTKILFTHNCESTVNNTTYISVAV